MTTAACSGSSKACVAEDFVPVFSCWHCLFADDTRRDDMARRASDTDVLCLG